MLLPGTGQRKLCIDGAGVGSEDYVKWFLCYRRMLRSLVSSIHCS